MSNEGIVMPGEYKDVIYRVTYFVLGKIAPKIPNSVSPNTITFLAFISACLGCVILYFDHSASGFLYWALFNFIWYILDALDGIHARLSHQTSEFGAFLDHFLDNLFFIVMFFVFTLRFDLAYPIYILAMLLRFTAATMVFIVQHHTGKLHLGAFSGGGELLLMTAVMALSFFYPNFNPASYPLSPTLLHWVNVLHLQQGMFMKLVLLFYIVGITVNMVITYRFAAKEML